MGKTIAEALIEEGKELGLQEGIILAKQEDLLRLLRAKFGVLSPEVVEQIRALRDIDHLDTLLEKILTAHSVEEMGISS